MADPHLAPRDAARPGQTGGKDGACTANRDRGLSLISRSPSRVLRTGATSRSSVLRRSGSSLDGLLDAAGPSSRVLQRAVTTGSVRPVRLPAGDFSAASDAHLLEQRAAAWAPPTVALGVQVSSAAKHVAFMLLNLAEAQANDNTTRLTPAAPCFASTWRLSG